MKKLVAFLVVVLILLGGIFYTRSAQVTEKDVQEAQQAWADSIVEIGKTYQAGGDYAALAEKTIDDLYAYDEGPVLFKPTKATELPFRMTEAQALSYFVGNKVPEDKGFAINPWSKVRFGDQVIVLKGDVAIAMGTYYFTDANNGEETKVEFTFGYKKPRRNEPLKIFLHHSSVPYKS